MAKLQRRNVLLLLAFFLLLGIAGLRALYLGTIHSAVLRSDAKREHETVEEVPAPRGTITDRSGVVLAVSEPADEVTVDPHLVKHPLAAAKQLAPLLGESVSQVLQTLSEQSGFAYLARDMPAQRAARLAQLQVPGIEEKPVMRRVYPRGTLAAQLVGMLGTEGTGLSGLEYSENGVLAGRAGERRVISDALGQPVSIQTLRREVPGKQIALTIDANIQHRAELVLGALGRVFHPKSATAIVLAPQTGSVLAMASWPPLNANLAASASASQLRNQAISYLYEPGSTFKIVTFSGSLEEGIITPTSTFNVPDQIELGGRIIHDDAPHPEELLTASQILARSSNVGTIKIALQLGAQRFNSWLHRFGFGARTGIELPGEEVGEVLSPSEYSGSSMGNLPIGQGEAVTPIQIATAYSVVANGGIFRRPHIIQSIGGRALPLPPGHRIISARTAAQVRTMMEGVLAPGGTAYEVSIPGYKLAGKTGSSEKINPKTGEYSETQMVASFVGFAPAANPKLLAVVVADEPQTGSVFGGTVAAPAVGQILAFALPYLGIPPTG